MKDMNRQLLSTFQFVIFILMVALVGCIKDSAQSSPWLYNASVQIVIQHSFIVNCISAFKAASECMQNA